MGNAKSKYFEWLVSKIYTGDDFRYNDLMSYLLDRDFTWTLPMDSNRAEDGFDLRHRYADETGDVFSTLNSDINAPCSMLEMIIALAIRCEEQIMRDFDKGDRTGVWFWSIIETLGLGQMEDGYFDPDFVEYIVQRLLKRKYKKDGSDGAMFVIHNSRYDMRTADIWYQANWYLEEVIKNE